MPELPTIVAGGWVPLITFLTITAMGIIAIVLIIRGLRESKCRGSSGSGGRPPPRTSAHVPSCRTPSYHPRPSNQVITGGTPTFKPAASRGLRPIGGPTPEKVDWVTGKRLTR